MSQDDNFYAAPQAELGPDTPDGSADHPDGVPRAFGDTLSEIFTFYPKLYVPLFSVTLVWAICSAAGGFLIDLGTHGLMEGSGGFGALGAGYFVMYVVGTYFFIVAVKRADNLFRNLNTGGEFTFGVRRLGWVLLFWLLYGLIAGTGLLLCIIPGIIFGVLLYVGDLSVILEKSGPIEGLKRSFNLVKGMENWFHTAGLLVVVGALVFVPTFGAVLVVELTVGPEDMIASNALTGLITLVTFPLTISLNYFVFRSLVARNLSSVHEESIPPQPSSGPENTAQPAGEPTDSAADSPEGW